MNTSKFLSLFVTLFFAGVLSAQECETNEIAALLSTGTWAEEMNFTISNSEGDIVFELADAIDSTLADNTDYEFSICLNDGCYTLELLDTFGDGWNGGSLLLFNNGSFQTFALESGSYAAEALAVNSDDCEISIPGCTDPEALNYNSDATVDDGSCTYPFECEGGVEAQLYVCVFQNGSDISLELLAEDSSSVIVVDNLSDGQIEYIDLCLDPDMCYTAVMSNAGGSTGWYGGYFWVNLGGDIIITESLDDNLDVELVSFSINNDACPVFGCTDPEALNYDAEASDDDGSCIYPLECDNNTISVTLVPGMFPMEVEWIIEDEEGNVVLSGEAENDGGTILVEGCADNGCYNFIMLDSFGDGWNGGYAMISVNGEFVLETTLEVGDFGQTSFGINTEGCEPEIIQGCTDPLAENYNPEADEDDGSCEYAEVENDLCANATPLTEGTIQISNIGAYNNENIYGECWNSGGGEGEQTSIWFSFTTPEEPAGIYIEASTDQTWSLTDTQFGIFEECGGEMIYCDGNSGEGLYSAFNFDCGELTPNTTYLLVVDGYFGDEGTCMLTYEVDTCEPVEGCTDPNATNYDAEATVNDGSCEYLEDCELNAVEIIVITEVWANEIAWFMTNADSTVVAEGSGYNDYDIVQSAACLEDGCYTIHLFDEFGDGWNGATINVLANGTDVIFDTLESGSYGTITFGLGDVDCGEPQDVTGCTDPQALNYNPEATVDDGSCEYDNEEVEGCTNPDATNYNPNATIDDGSCIYIEDCTDNIVEIITVTEIWANEVSWLLLDENGTVIYQGGGYQNNDFAIETLCVPDGCYTLELYDSFGDGWNGATINVVTGGEDIVFTTLENGSFDTVNFGINADCGDNPIDIPGCTDQDAINFDPAATIDDGSCEYETLVGCTDPEALNYDPEAVEDDGSCEYPFECDANTVTVNLTTESWGEEIVWTIVDENLNAVASGNGYQSNSDYSINVCLEDGCYGFIMLDLFGDGWNGAEVSLELDSLTIGTGGLEQGSEGSFVFSVNSDCSGNDGLVAGCTDEGAINYNPDANLESGGCLYSLWEEPMAALTPDDGIDFAALLLPNPGIGPVNLKIESLDTEQATLVEIHDMTGRLVFSANYGKDRANLNEIIDISAFAAGMHLVTITNGENREVIRLIKQH